MAIELEFPVGTCTYTTQPLPQEHHRRFFNTNSPRSYILVCLRSESPPVVEGLGLLFRREAPGSLELGGLDDKINGFRSIRDIMREKNFNLVIDSRHSSAIASQFGLQMDVLPQSGQNGDRHDWVIDPDTNQIIKKPDERVAARRCYQTASNAVNALTKSVLQEELWINRHVNQLAESPCEVHFEPKGTQVTADAKFTDPAMLSTLWLSVPHLTKNGTQVTLAVHKDGQISQYKGTVSRDVDKTPGGRLSISIDPPEAEARRDLASLVASLNEATTARLHFDIDRKLYNQRFAAVKDVFETDLSQRSAEDRAANRLLKELLIGGTSGPIGDTPLELPNFDLVGGIPDAYLKALKWEAPSDTRDRYFNYVTNRTRLGLVGITGEFTINLLAVTAILFTANPSIGKVFLSASNDIRLYAIAERIQNLGLRISSKPNIQDPTPLVVVGSDLDLEVDEFILRISQPKVKPRHHLSVCCRLLGLMNYKVGCFPDLDHPKLMKIRTKISTESRYKHIRDVHGSKSEFCNDFVQRGHIRGLMESIVSAADVLGTMPDVCRDHPYDEVRKKAKGIVLHHAASISRNDALVVLGDCFKPLAMDGCENRRVKPLIGESGDHYNAFFEDAEMSILRFIIWSGHPFI
ncbi:DNA helicase [Colletotrichum chrysophilum]|uniref:DNA helicase n=1 Tax=Colletotrichum chrysophilum TaxID=1836956 RepID=A0AAD9EAT6_9PEZI|nr:DNA helicase [Colletotrichum chrysophilum]